MANALGYINEVSSGFEGVLSIMNLNAPIRIVKNKRKTTETQPDYRVYAGQPSASIGAGWIKKAVSSGRDYVSISLSDPSIGPRTLYANLVPVKGEDGRHILLWNSKD